jgi:quercetin 2,3-dioxygenase
VITDGDTQWMTAGSGLLHIETPPESLVRTGGLFHGIQLWVNLPAANKWNAPQYQSIEGPQTKLLTTPDGGALIRLVAGEVGEYRGPGSTFTPITMVHATLSPGAQMTLPWNPAFNALAYSLSGRGTVGADARPFDAHQLTVFGAGDTITIAATDRPDSRTPNFDVLLLGGQPIREPVFAYGPFVMNTKEEVVQAFEDYQKGKLGVIPADPIPHLGV